MTLSLRGEIVALHKRLASLNRYTDIACQFDIYDRASTGKLIATGESSKIYGGRYDTWTGEYKDDAKSIIHYPCSRKQWELICSTKSRIEGNGGRGSGKSEGGVLWCIKHIIEHPVEHGEITAPTYRILRINWNKLLAQIPRYWLYDKTAGIRLSDKELHFINGAIIRFVSTDNPDALRSWGGSWAWIDEEQEVTDEAVDIIWPSLRCTSRPQMLSTGTPKPGEYYERHQRLLKQSDSESIHFDSYSNPFIDPNVFILAKEQMDERRYRQEILAEWIPVDEESLIFYNFKRAIHCLDIPQYKWKDITKNITKRKCGIAKRYIIGVDYNWDYPNYAVIWQVCHPNKWIAMDVISAKGHAGHLAAEIKDRGYADCVIIDDASGSYNRGSKSSTRLMRASGITVMHPTRNPTITDRINAALAKMSPVNGDISLFLGMPHCNEIAEAMEACIWAPGGKKIDKSAGVDHIIDAATYPLHFFEPPAKLPSKPTWI